MPARARRSATCSAAYDVVILDRYVASNAAYSAARLHQGADGDVVAWVRELEYERLRLPAPDWQVLLDVPAELAAERAEHRADDRSRPRPGRLRARRRSAAAHRRGVRGAGRRRLVRAVDVAGPDVDAAALAATLTGR